MKIFNLPTKSRVAVFIPTFNRGGKLHSVIENALNNTPSWATVYFITEQHDPFTNTVLEELKTNIIVNTRESCYAGAINTAYACTQEPYFFTGADDLNFHEIWLEEALSLMSDSVHVVGTNDLGSIPIGTMRDSTHYLVKRKYIEEQSGVIDRPNTVLYPYKHNWTDKEFVETAKARGVYAYNPESITEHIHWAWGKAQMDDTYRKGFESSSEDERLYRSRQSLWTK